MASLHVTRDVHCLGFAHAVGGSSLQAQSKQANPRSQTSKLIVSKTVTIRPSASKNGKTIKVAPPAASGTSRTGKSIELFSNLALGKVKGTFRAKETPSKKEPKILTSIQELRLLSKLEQAGLLSSIEKSGLTLSKIEKLGLLSTAEDLGLLSAANDRNTPGAVYTLAFVLFALGPAAVFFLPDSSPALVYGQYAIAAVAALGGAAAFGGASFLSKLQG